MKCKWQASLARSNKWHVLGSRSWGSQTLGWNRIRADCEYQVEKLRRDVAGNWRLLKLWEKKMLSFVLHCLSHRVNFQVTKPVLFFISFIIHIFHVAFREQKCRIAHSPFLIWCLLASSEYKAHATTQHKQINKNQKHACAASQTHPAVLSLWALEVLFLLLVMPFPQPLLLLANSYSGLKAQYNYHLLICVPCSFTVLQQHTLYLAP